MKKAIIFATSDDKIEEVRPSNLSGTSFIFSGPTIEVSDGYHTFDELYDHRITLFIALCKQLTRPQVIPIEIWKSKLHSDGSSFDGWFVLGIGKEKGKQITYHLPNDRWNEVPFAEPLERAPEFDGHSSVDVLKRIKKL